MKNQTEGTVTISLDRFKKLEDIEQKLLNIEESLEKEGAFKVVRYNKNVSLFYLSEKDLEKEKDDFITSTREAFREQANKYKQKIMDVLKEKSVFGLLKVNSLLKELKKANYL